MDILKTIRECVVTGHINAHSKYPPEMTGKPGVEELVKKALGHKIKIEEILHKSLIAGMQTVGDKFSKGEYFVPEMLFSAKAMKAGLSLLKPHMTGNKKLTVGKVILGTVQGDMHDIGKNLVGMMLEGAGFEVIDLGINISADKFLQAAKQNPDALVGLSALLTVTMEQMKEVINVFKLNGVKNNIIVGGAPVSQQYAEEIGAHGYAIDAAEAVKKAKELLEILS